MLGMKTYRKDYFDACRARVEAGLRAYRKHIGKTASQEHEHRFFNDQVLLLFRGNALTGDVDRKKLEARINAAANPDSISVSEQFSAGCDASRGMRP